MTKTINITVEVYDGTKTEEIERIVSASLDSNGIDCTYDVEEVEEQPQIRNFKSIYREEG